MLRRSLAFLVLMPPLVSAAPRPAGIMVSGWARPTVSGQSSGAAYLIVRNFGPGADTLVGVTSPIAGMAGVHRSQTIGGVSRMRPADAIVIPAGKKLTMAPGGYHVMLMGLKAPLKPGTTLALTVRFAHAGERQIHLPIQMSPPQ